MEKLARRNIPLRVATAVLALGIAACATFGHKATPMKSAPLVDRSYFMSRCSSIKRWKLKQESSWWGECSLNGVKPRVGDRFPDSFFVPENGLPTIFMVGSDGGWCPPCEANKIVLSEHVIWSHPDEMQDYRKKLRINGKVYEVNLFFHNADDENRAYRESLHSLVFESGAEGVRIPIVLMITPEREIAAMGETVYPHMDDESIDPSFVKVLDAISR